MEKYTLSSDNHTLIFYRHGKASVKPALGFTSQMIPSDFGLCVFCATSGTPCCIKCSILRHALLGMTSVLLLVV